jgi:hypothetical protein
MPLLGLGKTNQLERVPASHPFKGLRTVPVSGVNRVSTGLLFSTIVKKEHSNLPISNFAATILAGQGI